MMSEKPSFISSNVSLKNVNTFQIEQNSHFFGRVQKEDELLDALRFAEESGLKCLILGGGSNLLLTADFDGLVLKIDNRSIIVLEEKPDRVLLRVSAGENWHSFVQHCLEKAWFGLENLSLIPGSVGAAPMQNIGAYGMEIGPWIHTIRYYHREKKTFETIPGKDCQFGYRESIFKHELKGKVIIWEVDFELSRIPAPSIGYGDIKAVLENKGIARPEPADVSRAVVEIRQSKLPDPAVLGNAGSFFKNPVIPAEQYEKLKTQWPEIPSYPAGEGVVKVPAGWLIEKAGWKGFRDGHCGVHEKQALVLVNFGGARGRDILCLAEKIMDDIETKTGIRLQPEVNIV
jgi:UDP-N-acetylmuramate dehydrogenase